MASKAEKVRARGARLVSERLSGRDQRALGVAVLVFPALFSLILVVGGIDQVWRSHASKKWPVVKGRIERSEVEVREHTLRPYKARIEYSYTVEGRPYKGYRVSPDESLASASYETEAKVYQRYPLGSVVDVYYDPADPAVAYLEPKLSLGGCGLIFVSLLVLTGCIFGSWVLLRQRLATALSEPEP